MNKITYHKEGDYLIPDLIMDNPCENYHIGKYGRLRLNYIKNYKRGLYTELMINGTLSKHLADIENTANERIALTEAFHWLRGVDSNHRPSGYEG